MALSELNCALLVGVLAAVHKGDLVVPPTKVTPVSFEIFFEFAVHFGVLTHTEHDSVSGNAWLLRGALVPLGFLVMESAYRTRYIDNGPVLRTPVFLDNTGKFGIRLFGHQVNSTLK